MKSQPLLTANFVEGVVKTGKYCDRDGLMLIVRKGSRKYWEQRYTRNGRRRTIGIGGYPEISLANARDKALANLRLVHAGMDPILEKKKGQTPTFAEACVRVHAYLSLSWSDGRTSTNWIRLAEMHIFPHIGARLVSELTTQDLLDLLTPLVKRQPETARRARLVVSRVFEWAVVNRYCADNPAGDSLVAALPRSNRKVEHFRALPHSEVASVLAAISELNVAPGAKLGFEFLVITAARSGEVRGAVWNEIDLKRAVWTVPAKRIKSREEHRVPLSPQALAVLRNARRLGDGRGLVFPSPSGCVLNTSAFSNLLTRVGADCVPHGMRSSFRDWCGENSVDRVLAEASLAHTVGNAVETAYARSDLLERRRKVMNDWATYVSLRDDYVVQAPDDEMMTFARTRTVGGKQAGRDLVVGDVHGRFCTLDPALQEIKFDPGRDRLFGVEDLVNRGPHSDDAIE